MNVELATDLHLQKMFTSLIPERNAFIEVGLGSIDFSFVWAAQMGFPCHAVEPLPSPALEAAVQKHAVPLFKGALAATGGEVEIFCGLLDGWELPDISSLNPRWWGAGDKKISVPALSLRDYLEREGIRAVSCLKIDTEGSESAIISGISGLPESLLPSVICFEYGGGKTRRERAGGWSEEFFSGTMQCLKTIREAGYESLLLLESSEAAPRWCDLRALSGFQELFGDDFLVGNILCFRRALPAEAIPGMERKIRRAMSRASCMAVCKQGADLLNSQILRGARWIRRRLPIN
jgi:FkbM family methyltransferase